MSSTNAVSSTTSSTSTSALAQATDKTLGQDAFLKLLITELQNQDPMNPMEDKDFIAQLAQFSSLERMEKMSSGFDSLTKTSSASYAYGLVGKGIDFVDPSDATNTLTGTVDGIVFEDGVPKLEVGSLSVDMADVVRIYVPTDGS
ncbi:MAG: flagellar hook capping FlgD N-terminal domain-containing protein [Armatimonadota bacterium]